MMNAIQRIRAERAAKLAPKLAGKKADVVIVDEIEEVAPTVEVTPPQLGAAKPKAPTAKQPKASTKKAE